MFDQKSKTISIKPTTQIELNKAKSKLLNQDPTIERLNTDDVIYKVLIKFNREGK